LDTMVNYVQYYQLPHMDRHHVGTQ
jgi:hypothetical protein